MGITKEVKECPDFVRDEPGEKLTREQEISNTLSTLPDLSPEELARFALKMNYAVANGMLPPLTSQELATLRTISQKCIPDAPKQINLNASVKTEQVILTWLGSNTDLLAATKARVIEQSALEVEQLEGLGDFKANFTTGETEDG